MSHIKMLIKIAVSLITHTVHMLVPQRMFHKNIFKPHGEACIGVLGMQIICHDIGYFPIYFKGYGILCSFTGMLLCFLEHKQIQSRNNDV